jgi:hypothetical protein
MSHLARQNAERHLRRGVQRPQLLDPPLPPRTGMDRVTATKLERRLLLDGPQLPVGLVRTLWHNLLPLGPGRSWRKIP